MPSRGSAPISLPENVAFAVMMALAAYLSRENPNFRYPEILWAFLAFFGFNLACRVLRERLPTRHGAGISVAGNLALTVLIVELSGGRESYLWVMYLLPIFSGALSLEARGTVWTTVGVGLAIMAGYRDPLRLRIWPEIAEMTVKIFAMAAAAAAISRVAGAERRTRKQLDEEQRRRAAERLQTQERLRHLDRLATMGTLLAGITHELKGPLSSILAAAELLEEAETPAAQSAELVKRIRRAGKKSEETIANMLGFARQEPAARRPTDVAKLLARCVELKRHDWIGGDIEVEEAYDSALPTMSASEPELEQVVFNLLQNAEQAIRSAGTKAGKIRISVARAGGKLQITVADDGPGIPVSALGRIWEPFFTTKGVGQGTGLGLPISRDIVKAHGGTLTVDSRPGRTVFTIDLPLV